MSRRASLVLVSEHRLFRECLASMLSAGGEFYVVADVEDWDAALEVLPERQPDMMLIDLNRPTDHDFALLREVNQEFPGIKVMAVGLTEVKGEILRFIEAGASGYVLRESSLEELTKAVQTVFHGETVCSPQVARSTFSLLADLARQHRRRERAEAMSLTAREMQILELIAEGFSNQEIADRLFLSVHTVKNHVHHILEKLQVGRRWEAVQHAYERQWIRQRDRSKMS